jgi:hypothetical protein
MRQKSGQSRFKFLRDIVFRDIVLPDPVLFGLVLGGRLDAVPLEKSGTSQTSKFPI